MKNVFFFQTQQIPADTILFDEFKKQNISFSYFQVDQKYYLFVYAQNSIQINFLYHSIDVLEELDSKQRKIRSFRGFFLYALEIMEMGENYEILKTNLQPFFWRKVKTIIRQSKKAALLEFLFGKAQVNQDQILGLIPHLQDQIQTLQSQMDSLQQKIIQLESKLENPKYALRGTLQAPDDPKTIQQSDYTLEVKKGPYLPENDSEVRNSTSRGKDMESKSFSEAPRSSLNTLSNNQQYNLSSNQEIAPNSLNFITLRNLSEDEKIEIIQTGFQLQAQGKISLKKYYETTYPNSLFQLKGYNIKYESIRRTKLYQNLKE